MALPQQPIDRALDRLLAALLDDALLAEEFRSSRADFLRVLPPPGSDEARLAERRHGEWFALERASPALGGAPVEGALHGLVNLPEQDEDGLQRDALQALLTSFASVFEVTGVQAGEGVWVRDLAGFGEYPLAEETASLALAPRDVLVGRIFAVGEGLYRVSPAAGVFRNPRLLDALQADLERVRAGHRGVLRLSQHELEGMFWSARPGEAADPVERARKVLREAGLEQAEITQVLRRLALAPFEAGLPVYGVGDALAQVLSTLAFETEVDLDAARRALLEAWPRLAEDAVQVGAAPPVAPAPEPEKGVDVRAALEAFERGRREGRELEALFRDLERDLDLEGEEGADEETVPDFPGVVGAMVEEYLWDVERERGPEVARAQAPLRKLAEFGASVGVFENLGRRHLLTFAALWLPERGELSGAEEVHALLDALRGFCAWSREQHDHDLLEAYEGAIEPVRASLPRIVEANRKLPADTPPTRGEVLELLGRRGEASLVRDRAGREHEVAIEAELLRDLRPGDRLRAERDGGALRVLRCYPPQSAEVDPRAG